MSNPKSRSSLYIGNILTLYMYIYIYTTCFLRIFNEATIFFSNGCFFYLFSDGHLILCASDVAGGEGFGSATPAVFGRQKCPRWTWEMGKRNQKDWSQWRLLHVMREIFWLKKWLWKNIYTHIYIYEKPCIMKYQKPIPCDILKYKLYSLCNMCVQTAEQRLERCKAALCPIEYEIVLFYSGARQSQSDTLF